MIAITYLAVFAFTSAAIFLISGLDKGIGAEFQRRKKAGAIKLGKHTLITKLSQLEQKRQLLLSQTKTPKAIYWLLTVISAIGGAAIGKLFFCSTFFAVSVGIFGALSPPLYLSFKLTQSKSQRIEKLQSSMMILTNSYIVTEDFIKSVQDKIDVLEFPAPFRDFLTYVSLIDSSIKTGLRRLESQVDNPYFSQWIDVLIMAQDDRSLKFVTMSVVDAMNDVHQVQREADTAMFAIWREYFTILILVFSVPMIFRILMKQAFTVLITTLPGQILITFLLAAVVFSIIRAVKLNKPLLM